MFELVNYDEKIIFKMGFEINLTNIANGVYYIQLIDNGQLITTTKFIKN